MPKVKLCHVCFSRIREDQDWINTSATSDAHAECLETLGVKRRARLIQWRRWWKKLIAGAKSATMADGGGGGL